MTKMRTRKSKLKQNRKMVNIQNNNCLEIFTPSLIDTMSMPTTPDHKEIVHGKQASRKCPFGDHGSKR